jgi:DNA-directed RNA polymerase subunit K/omega
MSELNTNYIDESSYNDIYEVLENYETLKKKNKSINILNKYERTKILGIRSAQISNGAKPLIIVPKYMTNELDIATEELDQRKTPFILQRIVGNKTEYWKIEDLIY